jgi:hypothetical protein
MKYGAFNMIPKANYEVLNETSRHSHGPRKLPVDITNEGIAHNFLDIKGTVHFEFISQGQTVHQAY